MFPFSIPPKPAGVHPRSHFRRIVWECLIGGKFPIKGKDGIKVEFLNGIYWISGILRSGGNLGWFWKKGERLYSPLTRGTEENQIVKILATDTMVTDGIACAGAVTQKAMPGKWVATQPVPKLKDDGTDNPLHIPQFYTSKDPDNAGVFWELVTPSNVCVDGSEETEV